MSITAINQRKRNARIAVAIACIFVLVAAICYVLYDKGIFDFISNPVVTTPAKDGLAYVHFIDVGQGDCELIIADDGTTMLIDAGEAEYGADVVNYILDLGILKLDYVIATHPHSDHMGGLSSVISSGLEIGKIYMPQIASDYTPTTNTYEKFLRAVAAKELKISKGDNLEFPFGKGKINMYVSDYNEDNLNNYSIVIRYEIGESSFLFTGDIEALVEDYLIKNDYMLDSDVLKVAHHGSSTSSTLDFLGTVTPDYCVIECGDNSYNHPNSNTVKRLRIYTEEIYRTDVQGTVIFSTDGITLERRFKE